MTWSTEQIEKIPEPYVDFMLALEPIIDSRDPAVVMKISAMPSGQLYGLLVDRHGYNVESALRIGENLKRKGLVEEDHLGFFTPTPRGEELIEKLAGMSLSGVSSIPPFPHFEE